MQAMTLFLLLLSLKSYAASQISHLDHVQPIAEATNSKVGNLHCPNPPPPPFSEAWGYINDTKLGLVASVKQDTSVNTSRSSIVAAARDARNIQTVNLQTSASALAQRTTAAAAELSCKTLKQFNLTSYVGDRINLSPVFLEHHGTTTIYAFSFSCVRVVGLVYIFEHIDGLPIEPATFIKGDYFGDHTGTLSFFLSKPEWVDVTMYFNETETHVCELALFRIEPP